MSAAQLCVRSAAQRLINANADSLTALHRITEGGTDEGQLCIICFSLIEMCHHCCFPLCRLSSSVVCLMSSVRLTADRLKKGVSLKLLGRREDARGFGLAEVECPGEFRD